MIPRQHTMKPHRIRWVEAERDLAVRGFLLPQLISVNYLPFRNEPHLPWPSEDRNPDEIVPPPSVNPDMR